MSPAYGGWGGRYVLYQAYGETRPIWTNNRDSRDTVTADNGVTECTDPATIWRWRVAFQHDFAARMDWCVAPAFADANHNPVAVLNGDATRKVLELTGKPGETLTLSAASSSDPDGDALAFRWFVYREAGTMAAEAVLATATGEATLLAVPASSARQSGPQTIHVILEVQDDGTPNLFAYRRAVISVP